MAKPDRHLRIADPEAPLSALARFNLEKTRLVFSDLDPSDEELEAFGVLMDEMMDTNPELFVDQPPGADERFRAKLREKGFPI